MSFRSLIAAILLMFISIQVYATHNRSGEITYVQTGPLTIEMTITTYTKTSSVDADRDSLLVLWGDGLMEWVFRGNGTNNKGQPLGNDIKVNYYKATHTYPGVGTYTISMKDKNRVGGILNVNYPNSISIPFYIETTVTFLSPQFQGLNNSAVLLQPPIDNACVGQRFVHNPNAYDKDGDSLAYELITPREDANLVVPNYVLPHQISPGPENQIFLDSINGDFIWDAPQRPGEYNIAIAIKEYRNGILINTIVRDMQILVSRCNNRPPEIETVESVCVVAGDTVDFNVIATDPDSMQLVQLTALGGPFELPFNPASFEVDSGFQEIPAVGTFHWVTQCEHISDLEYTVVFKAEDNYLDSTGLVTLKTVRIKVVGPPPQGVLAEKEDDGILIQWELPYACENTINDYFQGFSVWRRVNSNPFIPDTCEAGLANQGYEQIAYDVRDVSNGLYFFKDNFVEKGKTYCYRVLGEFAYLSPGGNPFNRVQSIPSLETCTQLNRDLPFITHVDVEQTNFSQGIVRVQWAKPKIPDFDVESNPGPYRFEVERATNIDGTQFAAVPGGLFQFDSFEDENIDTILTDVEINTISNGYNYRINFYVRENQLYGTSQASSSIFLQVESSDNRNDLSWDVEVPWQNYRFDIYRNDGSGIFDSIGTTRTQNYVDRNVQNDKEYCYVIKALGTYGIEEIESPQINFSQEACGFPIDTVAPCAPELLVSNICNQADPGTPEEEFFNVLTWIIKAASCDRENDIAGYNLFFAENLEAAFQQVGRINDAEVFSFEHQPDFGISGCYYITAFDSIGNESAPSNTYCVMDCPEYQLPNTFTPNNDGANDLLRPILSRFIDRIECKIFNRWGGLVYETSDPDINWDGRNLAGKELADGVYYYTCRVFDVSFDNTSTEQVLTGYIQIIRN